MNKETLYVDIMHLEAKPISELETIPQSTIIPMHYPRRNYKLKGDYPGPINL